MQLTSTRNILATEGRAVEKTDMVPAITGFTYY